MSGRRGLEEALLVLGGVLSEEDVSTKTGSKGIRFVIPMKMGRISCHLFPRNGVIIISLVEMRTWMHRRESAQYERGH
jgi:hypothetical protein